MIYKILKCIFFICIYLTLSPGNNVLDSITSKVSSLLPANIIPCDNSPRSLIGFKLVTTSTFFPIKSSGLYFGMIKKSFFYMSLEGAELLHLYNCFPNKNMIQVNNEGEKSIFYGNHILKKNVSVISPDLTKNDFLLIFNISDEVIAIANSKVDYLESKGLKPNEIIAYNLVDKGYYLRKQS